jgi:hypothetical protein
LFGEKQKTRSLHGAEQSFKSDFTPTTWP